MFSNRNTYMRLRGRDLLVGLAIVITTTIPSSANAQIIDLDGDGLDDIWQAVYNAQTLLPDDDEDGDHQSNLAECVAGTDPFNPDSFHYVSEIERRTPVTTIGWPSVSGKEYRIDYCTDLLNCGWISTGIELYGSGAELSVEITAGSNPLITGALSRDAWHDVPGEQIGSLTNHPDYPDNPHGTELIPRSKGPVNIADDYGARIRGYVIPGRGSQHRFFIASRHDSELYLSTDENPSNATLIASCNDPTTKDEEWEKNESQVSSPVTLSAGKRYYIEVLHKCGTEDDHVSVAWSIRRTSDVPGLTNLMQQAEMQFNDDDVEPQPLWTAPAIIPGPNLSPVFNGTAISNVVAAVTPNYFRVTVDDVDTDGEGVNDWSERALYGYIPFDVESTSSGSDDFITISNALEAVSETVSVGIRDDSAYEDNSSPERNVARFRMDRIGTLAPLTVFFSFSGSSNPAEGSSDPSDYNVEDENGSPISGAVTLPFGAVSVDVVIDPILDTIHEYPEIVTLSLDPNSNYVAGVTASNRVAIYDAHDLPQNEKLFVGIHVPEIGASTVGFGLATLLLNGPNTSARINHTFSSLTSTQNNSHVHKSILAPDGVTLLPGSQVEEITNSVGAPLLGPLVDYPWTIHPSGAHSAQTIIDSLYGQTNETPIYINVHTENYPSGEIWAFFSQQEGSSVFEPPPDPPAISNLTGEALRRDVTRFLTQATLGPNSNEVDALVDDININFGGDRIAAFDSWIDNQFALDQTRAIDYTLGADNQEWVLREHFDYPTNNYIGTNTPPTPPPLPTNWPAMGGPAMDLYDSLDPATWQMPTAPYPLHQTNINVRNLFNPNLGEVNHNNRRRSHWLAMVRARDQLRQRLAFAWSEITVVSEDNATIRSRHYGASRYYDMLGENSDDTYRQLLEDVTYHPIMGKWLSHLQNQKAIVDPQTGEILVSPDENYAREIMQLFSIGLIHRHPDFTLKLGSNGLPISTYDNNDITEMARIFTGLSFSKYANSPEAWVNPFNNTLFTRGNGNKYYGATYEYPMLMFGTFHDPDPKLILDDVSINNTNILDLTVRGTQDISDALDALALHSNAPPFICRLLIQRLVSSNPSRGYIYRVAQAFEDNGSGMRGDLVAVTKAILLDYEARSLELTDNVSYGKQKEPIVRYMQLLRAMDAKSQLPISDLTPYAYPASQLDNFPPGSSRYRYNYTDTQLGQTPFNAPSVFNWFIPDFQPGGAISSAGLFAPEFQITTESSVIQVVNYHYSILFNSSGQGGTPLPGATNSVEDNIQIDITDLANIWLAASGTEEQKDAALVDQLDAIMTAGKLKENYENAPLPNPRDSIIEMLTFLSTSSSGIRSKVQHGIYLLATSPEYITQK
jgi:uncharacterized protein (DUF1800 family)